jgi:hypothetical protein
MRAELAVFLPERADSGDASPLYCPSHAEREFGRG